MMLVLATAGLAVLAGVVLAVGVTLHRDKSAQRHRETTLLGGGVRW